MDDILSRPRALRTLVELSRNEPMTMRQFMQASAYVWEGADKLLRDLQDDNLVQVKKFKQGRVTAKEIWLTDDAREIVRRSSQIEEWHEKAKKRKPEGKRG